MKRYPAYDPPEYVSWSPDAELVKEFAELPRADKARQSVVDALSPPELMDLYRGMLRTRLHDIMLKRWVRLGVISKAWLGTGEEAATVGPVHALNRNRDMVAPMIRNAGACCEMGMSVADMLRGYLGTSDSPSRGRDGHVGSFADRVLQPISTVGVMPSVAAGVALVFKMRKEASVALTWIGDGSVKTGAVHEAFNFAAVQRLPVIFIIQNNQVALGTRSELNHLGGDYSQIHEAYGMPGWSFDGNNVLDAYAATRLAADTCRSGDGPVLLTTRTFRMGGHATHDEAEARSVLPAEEFAYWGARDPIGLFEAHLQTRGVPAEELEAVENEITAEVDQAGEEALVSRRDREPTGESAVEGVYA
jgi:TPP-dependent pyruvate/acetoin dehydrogenase alpha subunit